jgi:hypothetical protein
MNSWELKRKFTLDYINAMTAYAESINPDHESEDYKLALWNWVQEEYDEYKENWEKANGKLEEDECQTKNTKK